MDFGLIAGIIVTWALIIWCLLLGGDISGFYNLPSLVLVIFGSMAILFVTHPFKNVVSLFKVCRKVFFPERADLEALIEQLVKFSEKARRDGILSLESAAADIKDPFMTRALQMAVDGIDPALIEQILAAEVENMQDRHDAGKSVMDALGKYAPAMGMIGTLVGLVVMLKNMQDPSQIGPGMAVAILTTLYGALIANGICLPISDRLARRSGEEAVVKTIIMKGILAIQAGDNPRVVESKLRTYLPKSARAADDPAKVAA